MVYVNNLTNSFTTNTPIPNTPLLLDFSQYVYPAVYPIPVPTSEAQLDVLKTSVISNPNYYIEIYIPPNHDHQNLNKRAAYRFNIPSDPSLNYKMRLGLPPSIGYGVNACYRVEFWEWRKPFIEGEPYGNNRPIKHKIGEQYWRIPTIDAFYLLSERDYYIYKPRYKYTSNVTFTQTGPTINLINNLDIIAIHQVSDTFVPYTNYTIYDDSLFFQPYFTPLVPDGLIHPTNPTVQLVWGVGTIPAIGDSVIIQYANPFSLEDIIYVDPLDKSIIEMPIHYINPYLF